MIISLILNLVAFLIGLFASVLGTLGIVALPVQAGLYLGYAASFMKIFPFVDTTYIFGLIFWVILFEAAMLAMIVLFWSIRKVKWFRA